MFDMLDSFSEWFVSDLLNLLTSPYDHQHGEDRNPQVRASVLGHPGRLPPLHPWRLQERRHHSTSEIDKVHLGKMKSSNPAK